MKLLRIEVKVNATPIHEERYLFLPEEEARKVTVWLKEEIIPLCSRVGKTFINPQEVMEVYLKE